MAIPLLARFPKFRAPSVSYPVIPKDNRALYPELEADFATLDEVVKDAFTKYDLEALSDQNRYRRQQVYIILGAALVTGLGGLQAVYPASWVPGMLLTAAAIVLTAISAFAKETGSQAEYLNARVKAEQLRALCFLYLSRTGRYAEDNRKSVLGHAVNAIKAGKEPQ